MMLKRSSLVGIALLTLVSCSHTETAPLSNEADVNQSSLNVTPPPPNVADEPAVQPVYDPTLDDPYTYFRKKKHARYDRQAVSHPKAKKKAKHRRRGKAKAKAKKPRARKHSGPENDQ